MVDTPIRLLVVDDDPLLRELLQDTLDTLGYRVTAAADGIEALERLAQGSFDLVITDIKMPGMDGIALLKRVNRLYPDLPVLFITGVASPEVIGQASPVGFLAKPFRISHIERLISDALHWRKERVEHPIRRVMVVDDDDLFREMLADTLTGHGFTACAVQNGPQALSELENGPVDAVITDIKMPGMDGIALMQAIKERHPELPVVLITAFMSEAELGPATPAARADGFLRKPFEIDRILELLDSLAPSPVDGR
ncbi:MAG TPA: response regulator, partial [candidate division Zixibacteria bacterium]|nr:response regulator [candidate division Zixibacteria bacterium]